MVAIKKLPKKSYTHTCIIQYFWTEFLSVSSYTKSRQSKKQMSQQMTGITVCHELLHFGIVGCFYCFYSIKRKSF